MNRALRLVPTTDYLDDNATEVMDKLPWYALDDDLEIDLPERLAPPPPAPRRLKPVAAEPTALTLPPPLAWHRRMWKGTTLMHFRRLAALALIANAMIAVFAAPASLHGLADLVLGNFAIAILIRQHYVINALFWLATRAPTSWPLAIRATLAKVYHFGGIHVGCAIAATCWYVRFAVAIFAADADPAVDAIVGAQLVIVFAICAISMPSIRARYHNTFEVVKRFGGWASLALLWAQTFALGGEHVWLLAVVTFSVALPWLRLRKVRVDLTVPSSHVALARFDYGVTPFAGSSTAISRSPLREWHSFANVPSPGVTGFRLTISRAGDWTGRLIDDRPSHVWVKGIPTAGVANIETLFTKVVYIATGSGIGPCLPHLLACKVPARLVWATRDARATYGDALVDEILAKHPDALIWDTHKRGKPDMVTLAYQAAVAFGAEAVICISNKKLTWQVVYGMESRGIPAYGAIWDS